MIATLALAGVLASMPGSHEYRLAISGRPGSELTVAAATPPGWVAAFCSVRLCSVGHVPITIAASGTSYVVLHLYARGERPPHGLVTVTAQSDKLRLTI
jgi:hypothetical protein